MRYKRYGKGILAAALTAALLLGLSACYDGNVTPSPTAPGGGPNPSTVPLPTGDMDNPIEGDDNPQTTTVPFNPDAATSFKAGTYTGKGQGRNGDVTVKVVFSDSAIVSIDVVEHNETEGIGTVAMEKLIPEIIAANGTRDPASGEPLDAVSGATVTSNALLQAVENALASARN